MNYLTFQQRECLNKKLTLTNFSSIDKVLNYHRNIILFYEDWCKIESVIKPNGSVFNLKSDLIHWTTRIRTLLAVR